MGAYFTPAVVTVLFLAVVLYFLARVLQGTVFGGIVRGLSIAMGAICVTTVLSGFLLQSEYVFKVLDILLPAITVCLVVLFQPEIRRALLRVRGPLAPSGAAPPTPALERALKAVERLSRERRGALLAWERSVGLGEIIAAGIPLDAEMRSETIVTVFSQDSPLHDGALIIRGDRLAAAACILPLGEGALPPHAGLRHRAALGLAEQTDAVVVVVSEETGLISVARDADIAAVKGMEELRPLLQSLLGPPR